MRLGPLSFGREWRLMLALVLGLACCRFDDLQPARRMIGDLIQRYATTRQEMRNIRADAMSRVKTERRP